jgi:DNA modification methylase
MSKGKKERQMDLFPASVQKMPEGYYSGDKPNPNLRAFVEAHLRERPYDPATDDYDVPAFNRPMEMTKATAIYNMHSYHQGKKPHDAIRQYIQHYTQPGDLVLDPFSGSGSTALAALMEGRKAVAIDRSPAATFITKNYCTAVDVTKLRTEFDKLKQEIEPDIDWLYETRCDRCDGMATTGYTVYSQQFRCKKCFQAVPLFDCPDVRISVEHTGSKGKSKIISACPHCYAKDSTKPQQVDKKDALGSILVLVSYKCKRGCNPSRGERRHNDTSPKKLEYFEKYDLGKVNEVEQREIPYWYPRDRMMSSESGQERWGLLWRPYLKGISRVDQFFTKRNLWALSCIRNAIGKVEDDATRDTLLFAMTSIVLNCSKMYREREQGRGTAKGIYYIPPIGRDMVVTNGLYYKISSQLIPAYSELQNIPSRSVVISTQNACALDNIATNSIDYIFTDPPYSWKVQYGEANFVWESWLKLDNNWHNDEIIVNEFRNKGRSEWSNSLSRAMKECYRVLKPGRWLTLCYHDDEGIWALVQDIMAEAGFVVEKTDNALFISTKQKSWKQIVGDVVTKRDLVLNFRKPRPGEAAASIAITGAEDAGTFSEKVRTVIRDYLTVSPGATKDRIYDQVVSRMVQAGRMEAHNFDEILAQVAEAVSEPVKKNLFEDADPDLFGTHEVRRWYLKETELAVFDAAESAKEDAAAASIRKLVETEVAKHPWDEGVHYSDIFEHFVYTVREKPRRPLAEWLLDYFYKTDSGTYRLPASQEEEDLKAQARKTGTNRRIKRYLAFLEQGVPIPDKERPTSATLVEWIRHCKRAGLYEQGLLLYDRGGLDLNTLSDEAQAHVEEDVSICRSRYQQARSAAPAKRGRKKS